MKNAYAISSIARQLGKVAEKMDSIAMGVQDTEQGSPDVSKVYQGLLLDEVEHAQILTLELTRLATEIAGEGETGNADGDGGAFGPGELTTEKPGENGDGGDGGQPEGDKQL